VSETARTLVHPVVLVPVEVLRLRAVPRVCAGAHQPPRRPPARRRTVEEEAVVRLRLLHEPAHRAEHVLARRVRARVLDVVGQEHDVGFLEVVVPCARAAQHGCVRG
jgi:hypothetical protein